MAEGWQPLLRNIALKPTAKQSIHSGFPFSVPAIATLPELDLARGVSFFVGANGSGKSTLLEAIAAAAALPTVGSEDVASDQTLALQRTLGRALRLTWTRRTHRGFFLRAEDFFGFTRRLAQTREQLQDRLSEIEQEYRDRSPLANALVRGPLAGSLSDMDRRYATQVESRSHGESFLGLFRARFVPNGLYLLDEPEAALSPQSQLALLVLLGEMVGQGAQFVIATHSPLLLAYPQAIIYSFDTEPVSTATYEELEHVTLTRDFLNDPAAYLRHLL